MVRHYDRHVAAGRGYRRPHQPLDDWKWHGNGSQNKPLTALPAKAWHVYDDLIERPDMTVAHLTTATSFDIGGAGGRARTDTPLGTGF